MAIKAWNLLSNGQGGLDWAGLPLVAEFLGITDMDMLMTRLSVIKSYKKPEPEEE